jgi:hypothetical protein
MNFIFENPSLLGYYAMSTEKGHRRYGGESYLFLGLSVFINVSEKHADLSSRSGCLILEDLTAHDG